jgi:hypothetical protein
MNAGRSGLFPYGQLYENWPQTASGKSHLADRYQAKSAHCLRRMQPLLGSDQDGTSRVGCLMSTKVKSLMHDAIANAVNYNTSIQT